MKSLHLLLWCVAIAIIAFVFLDFYIARNAPLYKRLERQWAEDVDQLESSGKLPRAWNDVRDLEIIGGTPETKDWLARIENPLHTKKDGHYRMEVLVVAWEEEGKRGTLIQYNIEDLKTKNTIWELGRTFILSTPQNKNSLRALLEALRI